MKFDLHYFEGNAWVYHGTYETLSEARLVQSVLFSEIENSVSPQGYAVKDEEAG